MAQAPLNYVLCSNPRSGSTLLCTMLAQSRVAGRPDSFFRQQSLQEWSDNWGLCAPVDVTNKAFSARYYEAMRREGRNETEVLGLRLMGPDLSFACAWLRSQHPSLANDVDRFNAAFGPIRFVYLKRLDKLAEAVSLQRAEQTGLWHQNADGSPYEQISPSAPSGFDAESLRAQMAELCALDEAWEVWFRTQNITPLRLTYEELAEDPQATLAQVLEYIGQNRALASTLKPPLRKLADKTSAAWIAEFKRLYPNT